MELKAKNRSLKYSTGSIHPTRMCGNVTIIGQLTKFDVFSGKKEYAYFLVEFNDGYQKVVNRSSLAVGKIENPNRVTHFGVGFIGEGIFKASINKKPTRMYRLWCGIISRGYSENEKSRSPAYKHCSVDPTWHNFQTFCKDISSLEGFNLWLLDSDIQLDKDSIIQGNKTYSKNTCRFLTRKQNNHRNVIKMFSRLNQSE
jgi:hypothetical protein